MKFKLNKYSKQMFEDWADKLDQSTLILFESEKNIDTKGMCIAIKTLSNGSSVGIAYDMNRVIPFIKINDKFHKLL